MSSSGNFPLQNPTTPPTSLISDDDTDEVPTSINGNPAQFLPYTPNRHPSPLQLFQQKTPIPDTPKSPTPENRGQSDIFRPYDIPSQPSSTLFNNSPNITTVADGLRNLTLHPHPQRNEWVTVCLVSGKAYDQIIEETVADYLNQATQPGETVRERQNAKSKEILSLTVIRVDSSLFSPPPRECRRLPPVTACSTPSITMDKTRARRDTHRPYSKIKLIKLRLKNSLDKFPPPYFSEI